MVREYFFQLDLRFWSGVWILMYSIRIWYLQLFGFTAFDEFLGPLWLSHVICSEMLHSGRLCSGYCIHFKIL